MICSTKFGLESLFPEVFHNEGMCACAPGIKSQIMDMVGRVCDKIATRNSTEGVISFPTNEVEYEYCEKLYTIFIDYSSMRIDVTIQGEGVKDAFSLGVLEVVENIARHPQTPVNPMTSKVMSLHDRNKLKEIFCNEISMYSYYINNIELKEGGYVKTC